MAVATTAYASALPQPRCGSCGSVSRMVRSMRATRDRTTAGAVPSASIASTRASDARMSASVGAAGTVVRSGA